MHSFHNFFSYKPTVGLSTILDGKSQQLTPNLGPSFSRLHDVDKPIHHSFLRNVANEWVPQN